MVGGVSISTSNGGVGFSLSLGAVGGRRYTSFFSTGDGNDFVVGNNVCSVEVGFLVVAVVVVDGNTCFSTGIFNVCFVVAGI